MEFFSSSSEDAKNWLKRRICNSKREVQIALNMRKQFTFMSE